MTNSGWINAMAVEDVPDNDVWAVVAGDREIAIYGVAGQIYATENRCTHGEARLCEGFLEGYEIECPLHQGKFDVRSGMALCEPVSDGIKTYPIKVEQGRVFVLLD